MGVNPRMAIRQRETSLDDILLKVVYPLLFNSGLGRQLLRWQVWHQDVLPPSEDSNLIDLASRMAARRKVRPLSPMPVHRQKPAA